VLCSWGSEIRRLGFLDHLASQRLRDDYISLFESYPIDIVIISEDTQKIVKYNHYIEKHFLSIRGEGVDPSPTSLFDQFQTCSHKSDHVTESLTECLLQKERNLTALRSLGKFQTDPKKRQDRLDPSNLWLFEVGVQPCQWENQRCCLINFVDFTTERS